jgi:hypothetical protein
MEAAITDGGHLPSFTIHSYLSLDGKRLLASSIVETRALQMHYSECVKGTTGARCYTKRTSNAVFIASDWRHLMAAGVPVIVVAPGQPCMSPLVEEDGLVWGCKPETLDLARVVNSLAKCGACGSWSTAPVAAAGVVDVAGT